MKTVRNKVIWKKGCSFSEDIYNRKYQLKKMVDWFVPF
ncbi:conserved hypothetical protein [Listeria innocua FSL J1-023]|nr:conserved hypothetical protein [Listeria innocua FSL J1-023]